MLRIKFNMNSSIVVSIFFGILLSNILVKIGGKALFVFSQLELMLHYYFLRTLQFFPILFGLSFVFVDFSIKQHLKNFLRPFMVAMAFVVSVFLVEITDYKLFAPIGSMGYEIEDYAALKDLQIFHKDPKIAVLGGDKIYYLKNKEGEIHQIIDAFKGHQRDTRR